MLRLSSDNRTYSEGRTEAGYISLFSWREVFCMAPSGIREEYLFPNDSVSVLQAAYSTGIHKLNNKQTTTESCTHC